MEFLIKILKIYQKKYIKQIFNLLIFRMMIKLGNIKLSEMMCADIVHKEGYNKPVVLEHIYVIKLKM